VHPVKSLREFVRLRSLRGTVTAALAIGIGVGAAFIVAGPAASASASATKSLTVSTTVSATYGTILVSGKTLYTVKPSSVACTAQCLRIWHEVALPKAVKKAKAGHGVNAAKLGTKKRSHGVLQVTYAGEPLYWFVGDTAAGQVNGNVSDKWGKWSVVVTAKTVSAAEQPVSGPTTSTTPAAPTTAPPITTPPTTPHTTTPSTMAPVPAATTPATTPTTAPPPPPTTSPPPTTTPTTAPATGGAGF
jgi:predicted lipoprotein with Yx(FWY)xxD motif